MSLEKQINDDIKKAMLAKDRDTLDALRSIKSAVLIEKTGKNKTEDGEIPESVELKLLQKLAKQRQESAETYKEQNRPELAEGELFQLKIIERYLPEQLSDEELKEGIKQIINETGATSMKDMGKIMGIASKKYSGKADNKRVSDIVKSILS